MKEGVEHVSPDDVVKFPEFGFGGPDACKRRRGGFQDGKGNGRVGFGSGELFDVDGGKVLGAREAEP